MPLPNRALLRLSQFRAELDQLFSEVLALAGGEADAAEVRPGLDIIETDEAVLIVVEAPGLSADELTVEVAGSWVTIAGVKPVPPAAAEGELHFHCLERRFGRFSRRIQLAWPVNTHRGSARLAGGVLTVEFPKISEQRQQVRSLPISEPDDEAADD